jgi:hypothetical protein
MTSRRKGCGGENETAAAHGPGHDFSNSLRLDHVRIDGGTMKLLLTADAESLVAVMLAALAGGFILAVAFG